MKPAAAIIEDSVRYEVGRRVGPGILDLRILNERRSRLDEASLARAYRLVELTAADPITDAAGTILDNLKVRAG